MYRYGVGLALVALVAAGCTKEHAGTLPSLSPSPTATATSASPTSSVTTPAQQIATAARTYYAALTQAGATGDTSRLRALVTPTCDCKQGIDYIDQEHRAGHHFTTNYRVDKVQTHDVATAAGSATVTVTYAPSKVVDSRGRTVRAIPGETAAGRDLVFRREGGRWLVTRVVLLGG
jgi:hypothetical protein